jgi:hypothetical protein
MSIARLLSPNDRMVRFLLAPLLVIVATCLDRNYQTDLWHHLARGRLIVAEGRLVDDDRFTYTVAGQPLRDASWGWQVAFYHLYRLGGLELVQVVNSLLLGLTVALLVAQAWRRSGSLTAASLFSVVAVLGLWQILLIRTQTASLLLFVLLSLILDLSRSHRGWLCLPPVLLALWANLHGGFPVGLILVGCYVMGNALDNGVRSALPLAGCLLACVAATCVNPYAWHIYEYVLLTSGTASARRIDEWLPPGLSLLIAKVWVLTLVALLILLARSTRRPDWREICLLGCFLPLACGSARMIAWWLLLVTPVLAAQLAGAWPGLERLDKDSERPSLGAALSLAGLVLIAVLSLPWLERFNPVFRIPGRAHRVESDLQQVADLLAQHPGNGRIFTRFSWGEYLGWALHPECTVFMDGRIEIIPDRVWAEYQAVNQAHAEWQAILDRYAVNILVLDEGGHHADLIEQVRRTGRWCERGRFGDALVFEHAE